VTSYNSKQNSMVRNSGVFGSGRRRTASTHFFVWNDPLCKFYVRLWPCESLASTHFF